MESTSKPATKTRRTGVRRPKSHGLHDARLEFRLPSEARERIREAALISGQSLSDFALSILVREANEVLEKHHTRVLSERDWTHFAESLLHPAKPTPALQQIADAYQRQAQHDGGNTVINLEVWTDTLPDEMAARDPH